MNPEWTVRPKHERFAALAAVLSRGVADGELTTTHALSVLRHQLRIMNVNGAVKLTRRSSAAQAVIERYAAAGTPIPKNSSLDALHSDHVNPLSAGDLTRLLTRDAWLAELPRITEVVCVTADENYRLEKVESEGMTGWPKYAAAGITLLGTPSSSA